MRILQLHTLYREPGGEDAVVHAEAELLRRVGHEVVQYHARNPMGSVGAASALAFSPWNPLAARSVRRVAERVQPDVAHVHNTWYALSPAVLPALRRTGVPVIMTLHNYRLMCANAQLFRDIGICEECVGSSPWSGVRHRCYRGSTALSVPAAGTIALHRRLGTWRRQVDLFLALSQFARTRFIRAGIPPERIQIKPNFVVDPGPRIIPAGQSATVLYVGRLSREKGVDKLLEAWQLLGETPLELAIIGDGPLRVELEGRAVPGIRFEGRLGPEDVRRRMLAARVLVLPSVWYEGQPMAVLEALAAGLPVLASGLGGMPEVLGQVGTEWLVPPHAAAWAESLRGLEDARLVEQGGARARALYERSFSEASAADMLEDAYAQARAHRAATAGY
jgi:glycosyltransferase involved in cell wall biosynthesis